MFIFIQIIFMICSTILCQVQNIYFVFGVTYIFYVLTNYFINDIHLNETYLKILVLISGIYAFGMFVNPVILGTILKGCCPILMNYLNKDQMTNKEYRKKKNEELFEIELQKLDGIYFDFSK